MQIVAYVVIWKLLDVLAALLAPILLPYGGLFSHPTTILAYGLAPAIRAFANFDGVFYIRIAEHGYAQFEHAFFPLFPVIIRLITPVFFGNTLLAGLVVANLSFLLGLFLFSRYLSITLVKRERMMIPSILLALLTFPSSFFFGAVYTEGLFFLFLTASFYFLAQKKYTYLFVTALLAAVTRFIGIFLFMPILLDDWRGLKNRAAATGPLFGLGLYMAYLYWSTGDTLAFFHAQPAFGAGRSTQLVLLPQVLFRYIKILLTVPPSPPLFVALFEMIVFILFFGVLCYQVYGLYRGRTTNQRGIITFSLINLLLPTATGTLLSIPRFALMSLSVFLFIGQIQRPVVRRGILCLQAAMHIVMVVYFIQGYFVS